MRNQNTYMHYISEWNLKKSYSPNAVVESNRQKQTMILYGKSPDGSNIIRILNGQTQSCVILKCPHTKYNQYRYWARIGKKNWLEVSLMNLKEQFSGAILNYRVKSKKEVKTPIASLSDSILNYLRRIFIYNFNVN